jgi:hypothetical protein
MVAKSVHARRHCFRPSTACRNSLLAVIVTVVGTSTAWAYIGDSFIKIPGVAGSWQGANYRNWIRIEANYWKFRPARFNPKLLEGDRLVFSGPDGPRPGVASTLVISMGKSNPDLAKLMALCGNSTPIPEVTYVQSSDRARSPLELGPHPAEIPDHWEYKLKDVLINDCPVVAEAPDQALVLYFRDIEWVNYDSKAPEETRIVPKPMDLRNNKPTAPSARKKTKAFAITWIAPANYVGDEQCAVMNSKPTEDDYYALVPKEEAAAERIKLGEKGVPYGGLMDNRGPHRLNATRLPGIVRDPGFSEPTTAAALGVNLDGDDGTGQPPAGVCKHKNYVSVDGQRRGIDNQLYTVMGCVPGAEGKKGYRNQTSNTHRADGTITTLLEISGIDNERNDNSVEVAVIYSMDKLGRDASGKHFIPDFTFMPTDDPSKAYYATRLHGRIVDGVVITDPVKEFEMNMGLDPLLKMTNSQMRLEIQPDGNLKGVLAGYLDWRTIMEHNTGSYTEQLFGYQAPGMYNALKRAADGLKNPATGECDGVSAAYEIDAVPAYIAAAQPKAH